MRIIAIHGLVAALLLVGLAPSAEAQRGLTGTRYSEMPFPQPNLYPAGLGPGGRAQSLQAGERPIIMITGYWPPTNIMMREFSPSPIQNPGGWVGSNWEDRGYDIYAFFSDFSNGGGQGMGDLEVDYQDTSEDFWRIADSLKPIAVITFSRGLLDYKWEIEWNNRNLAQWGDDYSAPFQPTPSPPDNSVPAGTIRNSTLPVQDLLDAINAATLANITPWVDFAGDGGGFLSEFIGYHGVWYQSLHDDPADPAWCVAAGHVHVGSFMNLVKAVRALHQTLRATIRYVDEVIDPDTGDTVWFCPTTPHSSGAGAVLTAIGSQSITRNDLRLSVVKNVPNNFGLAFYGPTAQSPVPFGDGQRCVSAPLSRIMPAVPSTPGGNATVTLDFTQGPLASGASQVVAGSTWHFQFWLRDTPAGGSGFTASSGLSLTFMP